MALTSHPKSLQKDLVVQELENRVLIYDLRKDKAFCLNFTAAFVWQHANGETPVKQIAYLLQKKLRVQVDESVVWFALEHLEKDGLLENKTPAPNLFTGMTRRDVIKTLGKTAVAVPLVFAITAPTVAQTSSCRATGNSCTANAQCCSRLCNGNGVCVTTGGGGCVLWDTSITTADGRDIRARDVKAGDLLLGVNCINGETIAGRVKCVTEKSAPSIYSIIAENGAVVNCSPSHDLIEGFGDTHGKRAELFNQGDALLVYDCDSGKIVETKTAAINHAKFSQPVLMFAMDTAEHTFISSGIISHNVFKF